MKKIEVCIGTACYLKGSYKIVDKLQTLAEKYKVSDKIDISAVFCLEHCADKGASVRIDDKDIYSIEENEVETFFNEHIYKLL